MGTFFNPSRNLNTATQAGLYYARRRRIAALILQTLAPWSSGITVTAGQLVSSENGNTPWLAQNSGVTGATAPSGQGVQSDGVIRWQRVDIMSLLQYQYNGAPTP